MSPVLNHRDFILVILKPFFKIKKGDTIIFKTQAYGMMVKKVTKKEENKLYVIGLDPSSIDSRSFGPVFYEQVYGKMLCRLP